MKSLLLVVLLVACATQVYSGCLTSACSYHKPGYMRSNYVHYPAQYEVVAYDEPCHHEPVYHAPPCPTKSSELYPCPYRQHGPCL
ncbi:AGAP006554-PA-like protein [Anopheles sinensis]|uniref:AGAP006554-PA-like protein n=1 Tax=Anopheles sinensis TaxID=74873 RepID=A0A084WMP5_ANOSI|nr:AGAP006554-PA-like protein [Anopheles sinensis]